MKRQTVGSMQMADALSNWQQQNQPFFFSNASLALLGLGIEASLSKPLPFTELDQAVNQLLQGCKKDEADNPVALGVIPFCESDPVKFIVPQQLLISSTLRPSALNDKKTQGHKASLTPLPAPSQYMQTVDKALLEMKKGTFEKVVLSRAMKVKTEQPINVESLLSTLLKQNPDGYTFCADVSQDNSCRRLIGSSPELLVARRGMHVSSNPLAGSRKRNAEEQENKALSFSLLESHKDLHEHEVVVAAVEKALQPHCKNLHVPMLPSVIYTPAMLHLSTLVEGTLSDDSVSALQLAMDLHPTPAVCGFPTAAAKKFIQQQESFNREYFTGLVGWCDSRGNGEWVVVIRSAEISPDSLTVFAGAGIVKGSIAQDELAETGNKMRTILNALNLDLNETKNAQKESLQSSAKVGETA